MSANLIIEAKVLGQKKPLFNNWVVALPPGPSQPPMGEDRMRLRDLITKVVQEEVSAFQQRQAERRLARIMTKGEIEQALVKGKVDLGEHDLKQKVDPHVAVETALQAFEDGLYYVFIEGEQVQSLDSEVVLQPTTHVTFIRLVALAGG
jgi:hypothetical protein